jgi:hypothetical protein
MWRFLGWLAALAMLAVFVAAVVLAGDALKARC